jgi:serine kinase of HPr protein (carbohydrate metabolism regulator)
MLRLHATCVDIAGTAVLFTGPSGSGKSDLALRLIDGGATLVADDQVNLRRDGHRLLAGCPGPMRGLIEVHGLGPVRLTCTENVPLGLVVRLVAAPRVERLPEPDYERLLGIAVPALDLAPFAASACAKVRMAAALARTHGLWPALVHSLGPAA